MGQVLQFPLNHHTVDVRDLLVMAIEKQIDLNERIEKMIIEEEKNKSSWWNMLSL